VSAGTAQIGGAFYIEEPDRSGGIRASWPSGPAIPSGIAADVVGRLSTLATGERAIAATSVTPGASASIAPLAMANAGLGAYPAAASIGLLVRAWGRVTGMGSGSLWIDDGSALASDVGHSGLRVVTGSITLPAGLRQGAYVSVTGISSLVSAAGGGAAPCVLARTASDIDLILP
jgi:hypothetical protein